MTQDKLLSIMQMRSQSIMQTWKWQQRTHRDLIQRKWREIRVEEKCFGIHVDWRLAATLAAHPPSRVDDAPEARAGDPVVRPPLTPVDPRGTAGRPACRGRRGGRALEFGIWIYKNKYRFVDYSCNKG